MQLFILTVIEPLKVGQRKRREWRFAVMAADEQSARTEFAASHDHYITPGCDISVEPFGTNVVRL